MGIKFVIHPAVYLVMLAIEIVGMNLAAGVITAHKSDKKRFMIGSAVLVVLVFLLDLLVFDFYKTGERSILIMVLLFFQFKFVGQISFVKCGIQTAVLFLVMVISDLLVLLLAKLAFADSLILLYDNYIFMYALYLSIFYMITILAGTFNIHIIKLDKIKI